MRFDAFQCVLRCISVNRYTDLDNLFLELIKLSLPLNANTSLLEIPHIEQAVSRTLYNTIPYTMYNVRYTIYTVQCTCVYVRLDSALCTLYSE